MESLVSRSGHWQGFDWRRERMVHRLQHMGVHQPHVLQALSRTPRHLFVEEALRSRAYDETALPIGLGQTISQPYTVGIMTQLLVGEAVTGHEKVLEIGTGCGYQTAILHAIYGNRVFSIERIFELHQLAKKQLRHVGASLVRLAYDDGYLGLPSEAPFDRIIVTAAAPNMPLALLQQLAIGGRMVLPLEEPDGVQYLWLIEKTPYGFHETCVQEANFVPLINEQDADF